MKRRSERLKTNKRVSNDITQEICSNEWPFFLKNSFERFGDDLCELILSYLSFENKFRFECVSKQFQRLVFNKQTELVFDSKLRKKLEKQDILGYNFIEFKYMSRLFKKCPNLKRLSVLIDSKLMDGFISLIARRCHSLQSIEMNFQKISKNGLKIFCDKFGQQLKSIKFVGRMTSCKTFLKLCPNLESLHMTRLNGNLSILFFKKEIKPFFQKLKSFSFKYTANDIKNIKRLVEYNKKTLLSIEVKVSYLFTEESFAILCHQLAKLLKLKSISLIFETNPHFLKNSLIKVKEIGNNCPNIKTISLEFEKLVVQEIQQIFNFIICFKQLKRLRLITSYHLSLMIEGNHHLLVPKDLIGCTHLNHLEIHSKIVRFSDQFFENIDKHFPKLQTIEGNGYITDNGLKSLSKLSDLKRIVFDANEKGFEINKSFIRDLVIDCKKMQTISLSNNTHKIQLNEFQIWLLRQNNGINVPIVVIPKSMLPIPAIDVRLL